MADLTDERLAELATWTAGAGMPDTRAALRELQTLRAAKAADAAKVRQSVRDVIAKVSSLSGESYPQRAIEDIATRLGIALASPQPADRQSIAETVRNAVLHFRSDDYVLAEKVATVCARQLAVPAAPHLADKERVRSVVLEAVSAWITNNTPAATDADRMIAGAVMGTAIANRCADLLASPHPEPTSERPRPGTFLASPYSDDMCSWCGQARWNHNKSATSNLEGVVCPRRAETLLTSELVRQVVRASLSEATHLDIRDHAPRLDAIADRAAEQLSGVPGGLSEADRRALTDLRIREQRALEAIGHLGADVRAGIESTIATLDRLLGGRP